MYEGKNLITVQEIIEAHDDHWTEIDDMEDKLTNIQDEITELKDEIDSGKREETLTFEDLEELKDQLDELEDQESDKQVEIKDYKKEIEWDNLETLYQAVRDKDSDTLLISEDHFNQYMEEVLNEIYDIPQEIQYYIDYDRWADDCRADYTSFIYGDTTYYARI